MSNISSSKSLKVLAPKLRFPEFTEPWKKAHIRDLGKILTGDTPSPKSKEYYGGEYLWVTPSDINGKETYTTKKKLSTQGLKNGRKVPKNSVLVTCIASIGKNTILREDGSCNQQINAIVVKDNYDLEFIYYLICRNEKLLHDNAGKGGMEIINKEQFSNIIIWIPNINEEKKISRLLSSIDKMIDTHQQKIKLLNMYKRGVLQQIFTQKLRFKADDGSEYPEWKNTRLSEVLKEYSKRNRESKYETVAIGKYGIRKRSDIYKKLLSENISNNKLIYNNTLTIGMGSKQIDIGILHEDVIYSVSPAYSTFRIHNCNSKFLDFYFQIINVELSAKYMVIGARQGKSINKKEFLNDTRKIPCLEEQEKIASFLNKIDEKIENENNILIKLKEMKKSLLQQMFI